MSSVDTIQEHEATGVSNQKMAMWLFLSSEVVFFAVLISTYLFYKGMFSQGNLSPEELFDIPFTSVSSFILLMSSLTMVLSHNFYEIKNYEKSRIWIFATAFLGILFISGQIYEYTEFIQSGLTISSSIFGTAFYFVTGFHGLHVVIGVILLLTTGSQIGPNKNNRKYGLSIESLALYWHCVDIVWIVIFTVVYLIP